MKSVKFQNLGSQVKADKNESGIIAFQMVAYSAVFYGSAVENTFDTKIMEDGSQIIIDGDGFFPSGLKIN